MLQVFTYDRATRTLLTPGGQAFATDVTLTQAGELLLDEPRVVIRLAR